jgi:hypothetical protein
MKQQLFLPLLTYPDAASEFMIANAVSLAHHMPGVKIAALGGVPNPVRSSLCIRILP